MQGLPAGERQARPIRKYRADGPPRVTGISAAALFLVIGIAMDIPRSTADAGQYVIGSFVIALACWIGAVVLSNAVWLTPEGIVKRQAFRRTTIPWASVGMLTVAPAPGRSFSRTIRVELHPQGHEYLTPVAGGSRYIQQIIADFENYRNEIAAAQPKAQR